MEDPFTEGNETPPTSYNSEFTAFLLYFQVNQLRELYSNNSKFNYIIIKYVPMHAMKAYGARAVDSESRVVASQSEGILGGVGVGKIVPTLTPTSI
jgi:hypothetical protein